MPKPLRGVPKRSEDTGSVSSLERLLAHDEIQQLANRYAVAVGAHAFDVLVDLFVDDVRVARGQQGREALRSFYEQTLDPNSVTILLVGSHVIDLQDADHATGVVYCYCETGTDARWIRQMIAHEDRYERRDGRWYFVSRRHELFYGVDAEPSPLGQAPANWPSSNIGRGSVPWGWPSWGGS